MRSASGTSNTMPSVITGWRPAPSRKPCSTDAIPRSASACCQRAGAPVVAFDYEHRMPEHRLAPARAQRPGKREQHERPERHHQQRGQRSRHPSQSSRDSPCARRCRQPAAARVRRVRGCARPSICRAGSRKTRCTGISSTCAQCRSSRGRSASPQPSKTRRKVATGSRRKSS